MDARVSTGLSDLDEILHGGLLPGRACLVRGGPGSGKSTLALQFLHAGAAAGESVLLINLEEPEAQIRQDAARMGLVVDGVVMLDLSPDLQVFTEARSYNIFTPDEVEREPVTARIVDVLDRIRPTRLVLDGMSQFRYLNPDPLQFRRQVLAFMRYTGERGITLMMVSDGSRIEPDDDLQFMVDAVINLENHERYRRLAVTKLRGSSHEPGWHAYRIASGGLRVARALAPEKIESKDHDPELIASDHPELDALLGGGLERGSVTFISGPVGAGKTSLCMLFAHAATARGEPCAVFSFEDDAATLVRRSRALGTDLEAATAAGTLKLQALEPLAISADEFARQVRNEVEARGARLVVIDGVAGYRRALHGENIDDKLHALCRYLRNQDVTVLLVYLNNEITGNFRVTEEGFSYLADNLLFIRYLESEGRLRRMIGVLRKMTTGYEAALRELIIESGNIRVGQPMTGLRGVLTGVPDLPATHE